jgi:hypothetical protein
MRPEYDRFIEKIEKIPISGCWLWTGATYRKGYGHFRKKVNSKWVMYKAHRFSYEHHTGPIPEGMKVLHTCDVTCCVNPYHLFLGTTQDNTDDKVKKGRHGFGRNPNHQHMTKLWADQIRLDWNKAARDVTQSDLARAHGISAQQMSRILKNQIWK